MSVTRKRKKVIETYGTTQQTVPVLMPTTRYEAFKRLILGRGKHINKTVRDLIEKEYGGELNQIERTIFLESDEHQSTFDSSDAQSERVSA